MGYGIYGCEKCGFLQVMRDAVYSSKPHHGICILSFCKVKKQKGWRVDIYMHTKSNGGR